MDKEQIAHDLALIVVENMLEDIDNEYGVRENSKQIVQLYQDAKEIIEQELE